MATTTDQQLPEFKPLPQPPTDGITSLSYLPSSLSSSPSSNSLLASTSWDGCVRIHDTKSMTCVVSHSMDSGPLLSLTTLPHDSNSIITGGLDGSIRKFDIQSSTYSIIGKHNNNSAGGDGNTDKVACSCLSSLGDNNPNIIASAGWDCMFHLWDIRVSNATGGAQQPITSISLPGKAYSIDYDPNYNRCVVATSGRHNCFIDLRSINSNENENNIAPPVIDAELKLQRESSLKYQTRTIKFFPDGAGIVLGSIEGRVAVEYLDDLIPPSSDDSSTKKKKRYAFKCHRDGDVVYPVNTIQFHPTYGTFATGGCDGSVVMWDGTNKKKLCTLTQNHKMMTSVAAIAFNNEGDELAVASSYTFEEGERDHPRDEILIRKLLVDTECKPKQSTK